MMMLLAWGASPEFLLLLAVILSVVIAALLAWGITNL